MTSPARPPSRRLVWVVGVAVAVLVTAALIAWRVRSSAQAVIHRHRQRLVGEREDVARRLVGRPALLEPAAPMDAAALATAFEAEVEAVPQAERDRLTPESPAPVPPEGDEVLRAHPEPLLALAPLRHAVAPSALPPPDMQDGGPRIPRRMSSIRWLAAVGDRALARGDAEEALRIVGLQAVYARDAAARSSVLETLVGMGMASVADRGLREALGRGPVPVEEGSRLARVLDGLAGADIPLAVVSDVERLLLRTELVAPDFKARWHTLLSDGSQDPGWRSLWSWSLFQAEALDHLDDDMGLVRDALVGADDVPGVALPRVEAAVAAGSGHPILRPQASTWPLLVRRRAAALAYRRCARVALAVALFTARTGARPAALSDLLAEDLPAIPLDPWDGQPLRYADGRVWSVGPDRVDDAGRPMAEDSYDGPGDVVVTLPAPAGR